MTPHPWWWLDPRLVLTRALLVVLVLVLALIAHALVRRVLRRVQSQLADRAGTGTATARRRAARSLTVLSLIASIVKWAILITAILWGLSIAGMNLLPVLTGAGIAGVAIGFGAQTLIRDFFSGLFMMLEGQFAVGDYVTINGIFGVVEELGLRVTLLRDRSGRLHYLPNGGITTVTVHEVPAQPFGIDLELTKADQLPTAIKILAAVLTDLQTSFPAHLLAITDPTGRTREDNTAALHAEVTVFPDQTWLPQEELPARLLARLKQNGVEVPEETKIRVYPELQA